MTNYHYIMKQLSENTDEVGNPQAWLDLPQGRSLEILIWTDDNSLDARVHCNNDEFDNDDFRGTMGVIETRSYGSDNELTKAFIDGIVTWAKRVCSMYPSCE